MKKCASCTKDLPDAALHCVFCGAKQPPAPAVAGSVAKTVMGHASSEMVEQLKAQAAAAAARGQGPSAAPQQPAPMRPGGFVPTPGPAPSPAAVAPTMFVPGGGGGPAPMNPMSGPPVGGPMGPGPMRPGPGPMGPGPMGPGPMGPGPMGPGPMGPGPMGPPIGGPMLPPSSMPGPAPNPYAPRAARPNRPVEPWKDSLRLMMYIWGGALLLTFMIPTTSAPDFMFNVIIDGEGLQKLEPLLIVLIGVGAIVLGIIPSSPMPRGLMAGTLGFLGIMVPTLIYFSKGDIGLPSILKLVSILGMVTVVPGLLIRSQYTDALLGRLLVTIGVICVLLPDVIPQNDAIGIVEKFKAIGNAEGKGIVIAIVHLLPILLAALSLLAWLPGPTSAGTAVFAWLWIMLVAIEHFTGLLLLDEVGAIISATPNAAFVEWVPISAYLALTGFGFATVFGKQLE